MKPETRKSMEMLFRAKWNVPQAAKHCGLSVQNLKICFHNYVETHPTDFVQEDYTQLFLL